MYRRWYTFLVKNEQRNSLLDFYDINILSNKLVICKQTDFRKFTVFDDYLDFSEFYINEKDKSYYEIILGEFSQKPHFDIDMEIDRPEIIEYILESLIKIFITKFNIELSLQKDILIFTSHGTNKFSYHIIIDNYCSVSNYESKELYNEVIKNIPKEYTKFVDHAVYNSKQQFRILDSTKFGVNRHKKILLTYKYKNNNINIINRNYFDLIRSSLVSQTKYCKILTLFVTSIKKEIINEFTGNLTDIENILNNYDPSHKIMNEKNGIIVLRHTKSYHCKICNSIHTSENPFLTVFNDNVYFHCRRANDKVLIGNLIKKVEIINIPKFEHHEYTSNIIPDTISDDITVIQKMNSIASFKKKKINF